MKVEVYNSETENSTTVVCKDDKNKSSKLADDSKFVRTIEGKNWNDCMIQHHEIMGWEPYKPMDE